MTLSNKLSGNKARILLAGTIALSFLGFLDATYLSAAHYTGINLVCRIVHGCDVVTTSKYAMVGPVPLALIGLVYYLVIFLLMLGFWITYRKFLVRAALFLTGAGLAISVILVYLQLGVIKAICLYCVSSAVITLLLFILLLILNKVNSADSVGTAG